MDPIRDVTDWHVLFGSAGPDGAPHPSRHVPVKARYPVSPSGVLQAEHGHAERFAGSRGVHASEGHEPRWVEAEPGWEICAPRRFSLVCFRRQGSDDENEALLQRVNASGEIFLSHTRLDDRYVLRLAIGNARTTEDDVRLAWDVLRREAARA